MSIVVRLLFVGLYILVLAACEVTPSEDKDKGDGVKLGTVNVSITQDLSNPVFNIVNYSQSVNPHKQIEQDFRFSSLTTKDYQIDQQSLTTDSCESGGADLAIFVVSDDKMGKVVPEQTFRAGTDDLIKISINNPGSCQTLKYKFSVIPVGN